MKNTGNLKIKVVARFLLNFSFGFEDLHDLPILEQYTSSAIAIQALNSIYPSTSFPKRKCVIVCQALVHIFKQRGLDIHFPRKEV